MISKTVQMWDVHEQSQQNPGREQEHGPRIYSVSCDASFSVYKQKIPEMRTINRLDPCVQQLQTDFSFTLSVLNGSLAFCLALCFLQYVHVWEERDAPLQNVTERFWPGSAVSLRWKEISVLPEDDRVSLFLRSLLPVWRTHVRRLV